MHYRAAIMKASTPLPRRISRKIWKSVLGERSWIERHEDFRTRERHGLVDRANYAYGMLRAADCARYFGHEAVTVIEFGVASGAGLLNMANLAGMIEAETGVHFRVVGFDTGAGLPEIQGYKDHPEIWNAGDFAMEDRSALTRKLGDKAEIVWGDIAQTIGPFASQLSADSPIGFVSVDVDIYSATRAALQLLDQAAEFYLPAISLYFDDVSFFFANRWAGELLAIDEFNAAHEARKIDLDHSVGQGRVPQSSGWHRHMYVCHVLDHPARCSPKNRPQLTISEHHNFMKAHSLY
ncbi:MAG: hypothetical protein ACRC1G_09525 [Bradyrhizobium sp.]|nr:hypothetical protein [Bradyrhizobium sp.]